MGDLFLMKCACVERGWMCVSVGLRATQLRESWVELSRHYKHDNWKQIHLPTEEQTTPRHRGRFSLLGLPVEPTETISSLRGLSPAVSANSL